MAEKEQSGVVIFFDIEPALEMLSAEQRGHLFTAIIEYGHHGVIPEFGDQLIKMAWSFIRPSIDRANEKYIKNREKKRIAGITSDFRRNYAPKHGLDPNDEDALRAYISQHLSTCADFVSGDVSGSVSGDVDESESQFVSGGGDEKRGTGGEEGKTGPLGYAVTEQEFNSLRNKAIAQLKQLNP